MRRIEVRLYTFEELSEPAKAAAREWYRAGFEYRWFSECHDTLNAFAERFRLRLGRVSLGDSCDVSWHFDSASEDYYSLVGVRLWRYCQNNMLLDRLLVEFDDLPFCLDNDILNPLVEFMRRPNLAATWGDIMQQCIDSFCSAVAADVEFQQSDECIDESITANGYEFTCKGERYAS